MAMGDVLYTAVKELTEFQSEDLQIELDGIKSKPMQKVKIFFDARLILKLFGWYGKSQQKAVQEMLGMCKETGASTFCFNHTYEEVYTIYSITQTNLKNGIVSSGVGDFVTPEATRKRISPTGMWELMDNLEKDLESLGIPVVPPPPEIENEELGIDLIKLERDIELEMSSQSIKARQNDAKSGAAIYRLRDGAPQKSLEKCQALLVTDTSSLARAIHKHFKRHFNEFSKNNKNIVQLCMTDLVLSTRLWTKLPTSKVAVPRNQVIAHALTNIMPKPELREAFFNQLHELVGKGELSEGDVIKLQMNRLTDRILADEFWNFKVNRFGNSEALQVLTAVQEADKKQMDALTREEREKANAEFAILIKDKEEQIDLLDYENKKYVKSVESRITKSTHELTALKLYVENIFVWIFKVTSFVVPMTLLVLVFDKVTYGILTGLVTVMGTNWLKLDKKLAAWVMDQIYIGMENNDKQTS